MTRGVGPAVGLRPATAPGVDSAERGPGWGLIEAAQRGDRDAFGQLYSRYVGEVSRFVASRVAGDHPLVQDVTSETFLRALRRIDSVRYQGRDVGAWLTTIARNLLADHRKSSRYRLERTTAELPDQGRGDRGLDQAVIAKETAAQVRRCVEELPSDQRECLRLRFWQDLSVADTAVAMGRSDNAVKGLTHRGVRRLRAAIANNDTAPVPRTRAAGRAQSRAAEADQIADRGCGPAHTTVEEAGNVTDPRVRDGWL